MPAQRLLRWRLTVARRRRQLLSFLDAIGASIGQEAAVGRLFTTARAPQTLTVVLDTFVTEPHKPWALSMHLKAVDGTVLDSGVVHCRWSTEEVEHAFRAALYQLVLAEQSSLAIKTIRADLTAMQRTGMPATKRP